MAVRKKAKRPYHHGDLRDELLQAGEAALAELPPQDVTLREIARRAGVSHAAPKHHFATLGELLAEIAARGFERFVSELAAAADAALPQDPQQRLRAMGRQYLEFARRNPAIYGLMFGSRDQCGATQHLREASAAAWLQLRQAVAAIVGEDKAVAAALLVFSTVHGYAMLQVRGRNPPEAQAVNPEEQMMRMLMQGLLAGDSRSDA